MYRRVIWQCNHKFEGQKYITPHLSEETIKEKFIIAVNQLLTERKRAVTDFMAARDTVFDISALTAQQAELENEMHLISGMMHQALRDNASVAQDQNEWSRQFDALEQRMDEAKSKYESVSAEIADKLLRQSEMDEFFAYLKKQKSAVTIFTDDMWLSLLDYVTVYDKDDIRFTFRNGTEIEI